MRKHLSTWVATLALLCPPATFAATDADRTVKEIHFAKGSSKAVLKGKIQGYRYIDYQLQASAGQTMKASMQVSNRANYYNILPPDSTDAAMYIGQIGANRFEGLLPTDGLYTVRVYLMRSAARRNENSDFTLSIAIDGKPLLPVPAKIDAVIPGTPYHAQGKVKCEPAYSKVRECEALVIRRGFDGTATVELRWDNNQKRRILFVKGKPAAADIVHAFTFTRDERGYVITFNADERFEVPEALVFGG
jgi:hypothetical protein